MFDVVYCEGLEQLLVPLTEQFHTDFALTVSAVDSTLKDYVQQLIDTKVVACFGYILMCIKYLHL